MLVGEVFARMGLDSKQYEKGLDQLERYTEKKALTLGTIFKGAFSFALGIGLLSGFRSLGGAITDFVNTAARTEVLDVAMMAVAKATSTSTREIRAQEEALRDLGIAKQEAKQMLTRFMQAELNVADATKLARVAQDAAVIAGYNSSQAAEQMTEAIAKQRPELLSAFGFTRNLNEIYNDYAKTVGKTAKQLSETEKKQAMLNYILAEGEKIAGTYEASMGAVGKIIGSLKRYWDDLKDAIAMPLALPPLKVIVDGITNSLKNAINWAEANKATLQTWGQTAADVAEFIIRAFKYVGRIFAENWAMIKIAGAALITYAVATKTAAGATAIFQAVSLALNGQLTAQIPILSWVSTAMGIYKMQMALAAAQGIVLTGVIAKLRVALYSLWSALGPIGWAILLITGLVTGGMVLWNKYTQSLQKTAQTVKTASPADLAKGFRELEKSTEESTDAMEDAGKAAGKNLQSFDEIHQLQEDMAGSGGDMLDALDFEVAGAGVPALDFEEMLAGLEGVKPTLSGFWEWIKQECVKAWDWIKEKTGLKWWEILAVITGPVGAVVALISKNWDKIKNIVTTAWNGIVNVTKTAWQEAWALLKTYWDNAAKLATDVFGAIRNYIIGTWDNIKKTASDIWGAIWGFLEEQWEIIKTAAGNIWGTIKDLITGKIDLRTAIKRIWEEIKKYFANSWGNIKTLGENIWGALSKFFETQWELIKTLASTIWTAIKEFITGNWEAIKKAAGNIWTAVSGLIKHIWEDISNVITRIATSILEFLGLNWDDIKAAAKTAWEWVGKYIVDPIESAKQTVLNIIDRIKSAFANMKITIPKPKLPHISVSMKSKSIGGISIPYPDFDIDWYAQGGIFDTPSVIGVGEAGAEAVLPLERNTGWMDTLAAKIAASIGGAGGGDIYVYVGNEQVDAYVYRSQDRRNIKSNGR